MRKQNRPTYSIPAEQAWAAAHTAWRLNGNLYLKAVTVDSGMQTNREIMMRIVTETPEEITDEDRKQGQSARGRLGSSISLKLLKGETLTEWHTMQARLCNLETFVTAYDLAVLASFPQSYNKMLADDSAQDRLSQCEEQAVGSGRVQLTVEVVKSVFSQKWVCWFVWGIDKNNHAVMFSYREEVEPGTELDIVGTVRGFSNRLSRLNRVKVLEQEAVA
jgi:hypothetical protein